jgi:hypothetical protein
MLHKKAVDYLSSKRATQEDPNQKKVEIASEKEDSPKNSPASNTNVKGDQNKFNIMESSFEKKNLSAGQPEAAPAPQQSNRMAKVMDMIYANSQCASIYYQLFDMSFQR